MHDAEDLYKVLQVDPSADPDVIKAAYRVLAQKYHPDHNSSPDAAKRMAQLNHAYEVLNDSFKRSVHNRERADHRASAYGYTTESHAATNPHTRAESESPKSDLFKTPSASFRARPLKESKAGKMGFLVGIVAAIVSLLILLSDTDVASGSIFPQLITDLWIGLMTFLITWGLVWSLGDLLTQYRQDRKARKAQTRGA